MVVPVRLGVNQKLKTKQTIFYAYLTSLSHERETRKHKAYFIMVV